MSGILDNKTRIMDTIVTLEGRRQIASADLRVEFVSFTDNSTYYRADLASGSADATERIYFEQCHLPQDQITFEADDSGRLSPFKNADNIAIKDGQILTYAFNALTASILTGSNQNMKFLRGTEFVSSAESLLASSIDNFDKLQLIGTKDKIFEDDGFAISNKNIEFIIHDDRPLPDPTTHAANVNSLESLFQDVRLSKLANFKYLPPINKTDDLTIDKTDYRNTSALRVGNYEPWGRTHLGGLSPQQIEMELEQYENIGYSKTINFDPTSSKNRLVGQFFEVNFNMMKKLDVIDYGGYTWLGLHRHVFFVGKVMNDENEMPTFIHIFTLVFG